jgi:16S rRNA (guanine527-N7)-methyltransferase
MSSDPVSRETAAPEPPLAAAGLFGDRLPAMQAYAGLLASAGLERGLIGPREVERLWDRHLLNCAVLAELIGPGAVICDVGSGAGLPGLVLALHRPDVTVVLVEPLLRRSTFLVEAVERLGLGDRVRVHRGRAEEPATRAAAGGADVVTARAVAPLERLVRWCLPLARPGGDLLAIKGSTAAEEVAVAAAAASRLGAASVTIHRVGAGIVDPQTTVVRVVRGASTRQDRGRPAKARGRRPTR